MALNLLGAKPRNDSKGLAASKEINLRDAIDQARAELPADWVLSITLERSYTRITLLDPKGEYAELPKGMHPAEKLLQSIAIAKKLDR